MLQEEECPFPWGSPREWPKNWRTKKDVLEANADAVQHDNVQDRGSGARGTGNSHQYQPSDILSLVAEHAVEGLS